MKTHNLQELANLHGCYKPGMIPNVQVLDKSFKVSIREECRISHCSITIPADIKEMILRRYVEALEYNKRRINYTLKPLYGKPLPIKDNITGDMITRIQDIMEVTGKSIKEIAYDIRKYVGYPCAFFLKKEAKLIPMDSGRILNAYKAMQEKEPKEIVEQILYK